MLAISWRQFFFKLAMASYQSADYDYSSVKLADFEIGQYIGKGQFSVVNRARCKVSNEMVALKKVQLYEMTDLKARNDCMKEIQLLQVYCTFSIFQPH